MSIKQLFDKDIYRRIEKVITYNVSQEARLRAEISEYIVTDSIEEQFEKVLSEMQTAMEIAGGNEVGIWVSGFYGSGKSSFTKYLGLALDDHVQIDGVRFLKHLQDRVNTPRTRNFLSSVANCYPAAVILLDLASEMLAGATMEDVSTVLYYKVLQWAGYSQNLKVAALERRLRKDGRYQEFLGRIEAELNVPWRDVQSDPLVIDSIIPEIAHDLYPELFRSPTAFSTETSEFVRFENDRVTEMIEIVREETGKQYIIFIIDEVGQYVGSRPNLILNLDGLAKNLKDVGDGKVWIIGTAQQTLTEDNPRATLNSPELYKLKDRFPIQINLESNDIKEICYRRLLGKSPEGERTLSTLFDKHGQALRHNTKLQNARLYDADFDRTTFVNLYPFLPTHFDVLLHLLGALAKSTGGIGLRSAIKVIQEILVEGPDGRSALADQQTGRLATAVTLYDVLERDIKRAAPSIHRSVAKVWERFPSTPIHYDVAKTVAILQILDKIPITAQNITSLMHSDITIASRRNEIDSAIHDLSTDALVPFGNKEGNFCFFGEKLNDIDQERMQLPLRTIEMRRIQIEALRQLFNPLPSARLQNTLVVSTGLQLASGGQSVSLAGEREPVQTIITLVEAQDYDTVRAQLVNDSRQRSAQLTIFIIGCNAPEIDEKGAEIYRCREIAQRYGNYPDQEIKEYCKDQIDRASRLTGELMHLLGQILSQGMFIFRGQTTAIHSLNKNVLDAAKMYLADVAMQVFDRYSEAPIRVERTIAEMFLRMSNLNKITASLDPLGLVLVKNGQPQIQTSHKALASICNYIERNSTVDGKRLTDYFTNAPFGWSPDTLRYLVAVLFVAGEITLKISGREVSVKGQQAIDALRTNSSFRAVGVALRAERPSIELLARAAERISELIGEAILPLEDDISKATTQQFPQLQLRYGPLAARLEVLNLPGIEKLRMLNQVLADMAQMDVASVVQRLGAIDSPLFEQLKWAANVDQALKNDLEKIVKEIQQHRQEIETLPPSGFPGQLRIDVAGFLDQVSQWLRQENFYQYSVELSTILELMVAHVANTVQQMSIAQQEELKEVKQELQRLPGWDYLNQSEQYSTLAQIEGLAISPPADLFGLKEILNHEYEIQSQVRDTKRRVEQLSHQRQLDDLREKRLRPQELSKIRDNLLSFTHPDTAPSLIELGLSCQEQDDFVSAEAFLDRAQKIYERALGLAHPDTVLSLSYLILSRWEQGNSQVSAELERLLSLIDSQFDENRFHVSTMRRLLDSIVDDMKIVVESSSRNKRSQALNRATSALYQLVAIVKTLPQSRWRVVRQISEHWNIVVSRVAGRVGSTLITSSVHSPYQFTRPVRGIALVGRDDVFERISSLWSGPSQRDSLLIHGHRRMGKTSVVQEISNRCNLGEDTYLVYLSLQNIGLHEDGDIYFSVADRIKIHFSDSLPEIDERDFTARRAKNSFNRFLSSLDKIIGAKRIILVIDEFDLLYWRLGDEVTNQVISYLRSLTDTFSWITLALVGLRDLKDLSLSYGSPILGWEAIRIGFLNVREVSRVLADPQQDPDFPLDYSNEAIHYIAAITNGQPVLVQVIGHLLVQLYNQIVFSNGQQHEGVFSVSDVQAVEADPEFHRVAAAYFEGVWGQVTKGNPSEAVILQTLASETAMDRALLRTVVNMEEKQFTDALDALERHAIIRCEDNQISYEVPLMRHWVQDTMSKNPVKKSHD